jgi:NADPH-dependent ferric siderophore reductase
MDAPAPQIHRIERIRREPKPRRLTVADAHWVTPKMHRIVFASPELADFASAAPDDHIKLIVPDPAAPGGVAMRDYTPRAYDPAGETLTIDFAVHEAGPATAWALGAGPGDTLEIGGPRGSLVVADDFDHYLLVGDETALPAIGRRVEGLRSGVPVTTVVVVDAADEIQTFATRSDWRPVWVERSGRDRDDAALLREALDTRAAPQGDGYVWIAAEAQVARALKAHMLEDRGQPRAWLKAAGYWVRGKAGESEKMDS